MSSFENPWRKISSKQIYTNSWITLIEDRVLNPAGKEGVYGKVHFKNRAIGIIPVSEDLHTWLVGQYRYPLNEYSWEIPMGGGAIHSDILDSAKRELKEETGLTADSWEMIMKIHTSNSVTDETGYIYLARELSEGEPQFDETEKLEIRKIPLRKAIDMVLRGEITDSLSVAGLLRVERIDPSLI
jgi:8-oxo-dGTP pyrophosphatase MutT (NUDIX family)